MITFKMLNHKVEEIKSVNYLCKIESDDDTLYITKDEAKELAKQIIEKMRLVI